MVFPGLLGFPEFEISFGEQVEILRLIRVLLDLFGQFGQVQLSPGLRGKVGPVVQIVKQVLIRIGPRGSILGERLEHTQSLWAASIW